MGQLFTQMPQAMHLLPCRRKRQGNDDMEGADLRAFSAARAELFLLIMYTPVLGFWVWRQPHRLWRTCRTGCRSEAPEPPVLLHHLDACLVLMKLLVEGLGTSPDTLQTCHAGGSFLTETFFIASLLLFFSTVPLYKVPFEIATQIPIFPGKITALFSAVSHFCSSRSPGNRLFHRLLRQNAPHLSRISRLLYESFEICKYYPSQNGKEEIL